MLREIVDLGFTRVELGHGIRLPLMEGALRALDRGLAIESAIRSRSSQADSVQIICRAISASVAWLHREK